MGSQCSTLSLQLTNASGELLISIVQKVMGVVCLRRKWFTNIDLIPGIEFNDSGLVFLDL
jgi:hypothetical protein